MRYKTIPNSLFIKNQNKILRALPENSIAVLHSNDQMPRNGDLHHPFRQNSNLFYASGIDQEKTIVMFVPGESDPAKRVILFIIKPEPTLEIWEGKKLTIEQAQEISGIQTIYFEEEFNAYVTKYAKNCDVFYLNKNENPRFTTNVRSRDDRFRNIIKQGYPLKEIVSIAPILTECRLRKEPEEIEIIKQACNITKGAFEAVLRDVKAGMKEYEVEAIISSYFISHGANGHAYEPIIASGKNACYLHYIKNDDVIKSGDVLFMDFGAEYANYASDLSRAIPVNSEFSKRQEAVYRAVYNVFERTKELIKPGITIGDYQKQTCLFIQENLLELDLISTQDIVNQSVKEPAYFKYFMHGVSHFLGIDTHDVGAKDIVLEPGMIVTCEPGIYIPEESLGIRLENDILLTENGNIDLLESTPITVEEIVNKRNA